MSEVRAGDIIAGKFQIERILGEGGMGYVVAARHLQLGQRVALKFMREDVCTSEYKSRFLREARNTVRLKSKHVSRVLDVGALDNGVPYMVMEYLEGTDLSELLQKRGPFPPAEACDYVIQACEAIAEAHGHGIIHRDLKPANLFLTRGSGGEPVVKVLDFGVSKVLDLGMEDDSNSGARSSHHDSVVTKATDLLGSPSYMAPEQVISARDADARSDIWSLGVILHRLISGRAPFSGNSLGDLIQNIMHGPMPNLRDARPDIPVGLEHVLWRCMDRERSRRPDAIELARMLAPFAGPNAAPSLERIAILGPALITAVPGVSPSRPSFTNGKPASVTDPGARASGALSNTKPPPHDGQRKDISAGTFLGWAALFGVVVLAVLILGMKFLLPRHRLATTRGASPSSVAAPVSAPLPSDTVLSEPLPPPAVSPSTGIVSAKPSAQPSSRPAVRPSSAGHTRPRPAASPTAPATSEIPPTRE